MLILHDVYRDLILSLGKDPDFFPITRQGKARSPFLTLNDLWQLKISETFILGVRSLDNVKSQVSQTIDYQVQPQANAALIDLYSIYRDLILSKNKDPDYLPITIQGKAGTTLFTLGDLADIKFYETEIIRISDDLNHFQVESDIEVNPQVESDIEVNPQVESDIEVNPQVESDIEVNPQVGD